MNPRLKTALYYLAATLIAALVSVGVTVHIMNKQKEDLVVLDAQTFSHYDALTPLLDMMDLIEQAHLNEGITREQLLEGALEGALASVGDPYSRYFTEEEYISFLEQLDGSYHGIGALIGQPTQEGVTILKVYAKSPAEQAGLQTGDMITSLDGTSLCGRSLEEVELLFAGEDGSVATLEVLQNGVPRSFEIARGMGSISYVESKLFLQYTGYIRLDKFTGTAAEDFIEAISDLTDRGMRSLVVDLRNNPGGELEQVVSIADELLASCPIVSVRPKNGEAQSYNADSKCTTVPLAVLVNEHSASASEILAAAIQENGRGIVVGTGTFGKGVVQTTHQLKSNEGWVKMTTAAYYTPQGHNLEGRGVVPDIEIDLSLDMKALPIDQIEQDDDAQLWAALDEVREQADALDAA